MKAQISKCGRVFNTQPFAAECEFLQTSPLKNFSSPTLIVEAQAEAHIAHWFSRGWRRSARDLRDFVSPVAFDFET